MFPTHMLLHKLSNISKKLFWMFVESFTINILHVMEQTNVKGQNLLEISNLKG